MRHEEQHLVISPVHGRLIKVLHHVNNVQRQPADPKNHDHRDQHAISPLLPLPVCLLPPAGLAAWLQFRPVVQSHRDADITERNDDKWHGELQYRRQRAEGHAEWLIRPGLFAVPHSRTPVVGLGLHVEAVGKGQHPRHDPDSHDDAHAHAYLHPRSERIEYDQKPVHSYAGQRQCADVDADTLGVGHQMTKSVTEDPAAEKGIEGRKGNSQDAEEDVAKSQISDEEVGDRLHLTVASDDEADEGIPEDAQEEDAGVEGTDDQLEREVGRGEVLRQGQEALVRTVGVLGAVAAMAEDDVVHGEGGEGQVQMASWLLEQKC